jgi:hypothetical protein
MLRSEPGLSADGNHSARGAEASNLPPHRGFLSALNLGSYRTVAAIALAPMTPTPGTVASKRRTRLFRGHLAKRSSISRILASVHASRP